MDAKIGAAGALVEALPDERAAERPQMLFWLAVARVFTGRLKPAHAAAERGIRVVRGSGQGLYVPAFVLVRGWVDAKIGRLDAAEADVEESLESALVSGNPQVAYWSSIVSSRIALARGRLEEAIEHGEAAWERIGIIGTRRRATPSPMPGSPPATRVGRSPRSRRSAGSSPRSGRSTA